MLYLKRSKFFYFTFLCCRFYRIGLSKRKFKDIFCVWRKQFMEILELILKGRDIFSSNEEKNIAEFFVGVTRPSKIFSFDLSRIFEVKRTKLLLVFFKHFFNSLVWIFAVTNRNEKIILFMDLYDSENNCWKKTHKNVKQELLNSLTENGETEEPEINIASVIDPG